MPANAARKAIRAARECLSMKSLPHLKYTRALIVLGMTALAACNSTTDVLEPSALVDDDSEPGSPGLSSSGSTDASNQLAAIAASARIQFAPVVGAPADASQALAGRLSSQAASRGISLINGGQSADSLTMKGYFSAITERGQTTVIYVWDVIDPAGTRVHRIHGQAKAPATIGEGWDSVQATTMEAIADESVERLAAWLATQQG